MSKSVHLWRLHLHPAELSGFANQQGLPPSDVGYHVHAALYALFGKEHAPRPFDWRHLRPHGGGVGTLQILGYAPHEAKAAEAHRQWAEPGIERLLVDDRVESKPLPSLSAGLRLAFELRACPVRRTREGRGSKTHERDVFKLAQVSNPQIQRHEAYLKWLAERLAHANAARLDHAELTGRINQKLLYRRDENRRMNQEPMEHPQIDFAGVLEISDPAAFSDLLLGGVGRHTGFGFGMLRLKPAR
ncbi:type I-E CRISPR-associated protein Cas6/Cse3/CasE [Magnetofaba australis]|uniref:Putative CRISPR-associated protein, Cse3 family n=1 Tax=Magnetofaba australis IT-1 TaxID=1434232 RepID=A0A1Y2JZP5_9PROT|nr:type I-E CRISPR-associated protein Cas6/Cse3/CasE [Magnetofaba australis]OSM00326.1 putative CRISPR-associated protein, Cse3 family [Magnetofaba australis IT-1]